MEGPVILHLRLKKVILAFAEQLSFIRQVYFCSQNFADMSSMSASGGYPDPDSNNIVEINTHEKRACGASEFILFARHKQHGQPGLS